jgi:hypothetical protein
VRPVSFPVDKRWLSLPSSLRHRHVDDDNDDADDDDDDDDFGPT